MATHVRLLLLMILASVAVGCSKPARLEPIQSVAKPALMAHPEYVNWSQFSLGASVTREKVVSSDGSDLRVTTTLRLTGKRDDQVTVTSQTTVQRPGEPPLENPPQEFRFPAQFQLPEGMDPQTFSLPSLKAKYVGEESLAIGDQKYSATLYTWDEVNETGPMAIKYWRSDDVPGRFVRQTVEGANHRSLEEAVAVHATAAKP